MVGKLDEISHAIGAIEAAIRDLQRRADEDRETRDRWHAESRAAIAALTHKLDQHAASVVAMQPAVASIAVLRSKLAWWGSLGLGVVVVFGWVVEASVKSAVAFIWSHFH